MAALRRALSPIFGESVRVSIRARYCGPARRSVSRAMEWSALGLPEDYLPLLAPGRSAFVRHGERIVGHGGISLEEVVVPLVQIERLAR